MSTNGNGTGPRVLLVYYSHTDQTRKVADAMTAVFRTRGCEVAQAAIEFTDQRFAEKFSRFPFRHALLDLFAVLPGQIGRRTGQIRIPDAAKEADYDLVCFGSPTWFFTTNMPLRSYLKSDEAGKVLAGKRFAAYVVCRRYWSINLKEVRKLGSAKGGAYLGGTKFQFAGGQIRSFLALISYFGSGEMRERYLGVKIPPTNLKPDFAEAASAFASRLADAVGEREATMKVEA